MGSVTLITRDPEAPADFARGIPREKGDWNNNGGRLMNMGKKILSSVNLRVSEPSCKEPMMDTKVMLVFNHQNRLFQTQANSVES